MTENMTSNMYRMMGGFAQLDLSSFQCRSWDFIIPGIDYKITTHYPGFIFSTMFYFGLGTAGYYLGRTVMRAGRCLMTYFKSKNNATKYLNSKREGAEEPYTAVIFGAGTKPGRIYATFLAQRGFNLVLVERD